ncbi:hypothetical protein [Paraburkholderia sp.]|uniref:hypothetical protein n=1 Tax=Paraburkholderia sp. TaxID=1926495 RepID=UPI00238EE210|nr:hypothetical protein [Paraburkholderia sp.]MDE1180311.1 hypothetical protein [Paraburkholderia sp.]
MPVYLRRLSTWVALTACLFPVSRAVAVDGGATLTTHSKNLKGSITLSDAGRDRHGMKKYAYRIELSSPTCRSTFTGFADFFKRSGELTDSTYLQNGKIVKTTLFKDSNAVGTVILEIDTDSPKPGFAGASFYTPKPVPGSCVKGEGGGIDFYTW